MTLQKKDKEVYACIKGEEKRQEEGLELIASENYVSEAVKEALGSVFTNKYSEGYPGKRYYGGQKYTDAVERLAIDRAKKLFSAQHVNVQPHSGAPANMIVYNALLQQGDTVLGMDLAHGGHLTHGHPLTLSAKIYNFVGYKTDCRGKIDYENLYTLAKKYNPKIILIGFSSYSRSINYRKCRSIANKVGAILMMDMAHIAGLIAGKALPNPVPFCDVVTTTTHKTLRGPRGGMILCKKNIAHLIDKSTFPGFQGGPHMNNIAAKAVSFHEALQPSFKKYAQSVIDNAKTLEDELKKHGFNICFGKTENHMMLIDMVKSKNLTGKEAEELLDNIGITLNKNLIPNDQRSPMDPSGIRIGVAAMTTRGMKKNEMKKIARIINDACNYRSDFVLLKKLHQEVKKMCMHFPIYK